MSSRYFLVATILVATFSQVHSLPSPSSLAENGTVPSPIRPVLRLQNNLEKPTFVIEISEHRESIIKYWEDLNNISGFCATGTWLVYTQSGYTTGGVGGLIFSNDTKTCSGRMWPTVASFRFAGSAEDIHTPTLTTYTGEGYRGVSRVYSEELNSLTVPFTSFIITGSQPVSIFSREDFGGFSMCIDSPQNGLGAGLRNVTRDLGLLPEEIKSFRFGCPEGMSRIPLERNSG